MSLEREEGLCGRLPNQKSRRSQSRKKLAIVVKYWNSLSGRVRTCEAFVFFSLYFGVVPGTRSFETAERHLARLRTRSKRL